MARLGALGFAALLGAPKARLARALAHPALTGLGTAAWEAVLLCPALLELSARALGPSFRASAPGFLALNLVLWTSATLVAGLCERLVR